MADALIAVSPKDTRAQRQLDALLEQEGICRDGNLDYTCGLFDSIPKLDEDSTKLVPIDGMTPNMAEPPTGCYFHPRCKYCQDICKTQSPVMTEGSHRFKCFFPLGNPVDEKGE